MNILRRLFSWNRAQEDVDDTEDDSQAEVETDEEEAVQSPRPGDLLRYAKLVDIRNEPNKGFFTVSPSKCQEADIQTPPRPTRVERRPLPSTEVDPLRVTRPWIPNLVPDEEQKVLGLRWPYSKDQLDSSSSGIRCRRRVYGRNTVEGKGFAIAEPVNVYRTPGRPKPVRILFEEETEGVTSETVPEECSFVEEITQMDRDLYERIETVFTDDRDVCPETAKRLKRRRLNEEDNVRCSTSTVGNNKTRLFSLL